MEATKQKEQEEQKMAPIFDEINQIDPQSAISILIQASQMAQRAGALGVRDSVMLAKAIDVLRPGSI